MFSKTTSCLSVQTAPEGTTEQSPLWLGESTGAIGAEGMWFKMMEEKYQNYIRSRAGAEAPSVYTWECGYASHYGYYLSFTDL